MKRTIVLEATVKNTLAREIVSAIVREKWKDLESRDPPIIKVTEERMEKGKIKKQYTFHPYASMTVKEVFSLLQYFPLLFQKIKPLFTGSLKSQ